MASSASRPVPVIGDEFDTLSIVATGSRLGRRLPDVRAPDDVTRGPMHAVMIEFSSRVTGAELATIIADDSVALDATPGLVSTTWTVDEDIVGNFLVFVDRIAAERFLSGESFDVTMLNPNFVNFRVSRLDVVDHIRCRSCNPRVRALPRPATDRRRGASRSWLTMSKSTA